MVVLRQDISIIKPFRWSFLKTIVISSYILGQILLPFHVCMLKSNFITTTLCILNSVKLSLLYLCRYSREEPFTALNMDIRNQQHLFESLDAFVKGDLLEGANAYHCEKCDKKVDTVKRMCIKKLPKILCIQLKRFDYDWERYRVVFTQSIITALVVLPIIITFTLFFVEKWP